MGMVRKRPEKAGKGGFLGVQVRTVACSILHSLEMNLVSRLRGCCRKPLPPRAAQLRRIRCISSDYQHIILCSCYRELSHWRLGLSTIQSIPITAPLLMILATYVSCLTWERLLGLPGEYIIASEGESRTFQLMVTILQ